MLEEKEEVKQIATNLQESAQSIVKACDYLNSSTEDVLEERFSAPVLSVGKDAAPLLCSLKNLGDKVLNEDMKKTDLTKKLEAIAATMKKQTQIQTDLLDKMGKKIKNMQCLMPMLKKSATRENNSSAGEELSSFDPEDVVASSPIDFVEKQE